MLLRGTASSCIRQPDTTDRNCVLHSVRGHDGVGLGRRLFGTLS